MKREYGDVANFLIVYVREAHACDEWETKDNVRAGIRIPQPRSPEERRAAAARMIGETGLTIPVAVDGVADAAAIPFGAWPGRIYVLDVHGRVAYRGGPGPFEFRPEEAEEILRALRHGEP